MSPFFWGVHSGSPSPWFIKTAILMGEVRLKDSAWVKMTKPCIHGLVGSKSQTVQVLDQYSNH